MNVVGIDGCRGGWVAAAVLPSGLDVRAFATFRDLLADSIIGQANHLVVDMPIGLLSGRRCAARGCDQAARDLLRSFGKASSVFTPPTRDLLFEKDYRGTGMTPLSAALRPRIAEIDELMDPELQARVVEGHPELSFAMRAGQVPTKKSVDGLKARRAWLNSQGLSWNKAIPPIRGVNVSEEDLLDALVLMLVAQDIAQGLTKRIPVHPNTDARGLRMEMWY